MPPQPRLFGEARGLLKKGKRATKLRPSYRAVYRRHSLMRLRSGLRCYALYWY